MSHYHLSITQAGELVHESSERTEPDVKDTLGHWATADLRGERRFLVCITECDDAECFEGVDNTEA